MSLALLAVLWFVGQNVFPLFLFGAPLHLAFQEVPAKFRMTASRERPAYLLL
jgi:hypothetical protein